MAETEFSIKLPRFDYISQDNTYSGSFNDFRYKIFPKKKDDIETVIVAAVYKNNCFEIEDAAGRAKTAEFEYSNDGIDVAENWIREQQANS